MKKDRHNFNRNIKLHTVCGIDELRPSMNYIYFDNGYAVASNGHILIKACLHEISTFDDNEIEMLNGKFIHHNAFALLIKYGFCTVEEDGFLVSSSDYDLKIKFYDGEELRYPRYQHLFDEHQTTLTDKIRLDSDLLNKLGSSVGSKDVRLGFGKYNHAIMISFVEEDLINTIGLIMPKMDE